MSDGDQGHLFDPAAFTRPGARQRVTRTPAKPIDIVSNNGGWIGLARRDHKSAAFAHIVAAAYGVGAVRTACGLHGDPLKSRPASR